MALATMTRKLVYPPNLRELDYRKSDNGNFEVYILWAPGMDGLLLMVDDHRYPERSFTAPIAASEYHKALDHPSIYEPTR